ncbi:helix-turn-helix domain-containing protein, partial [Staphylococcus pseudintermedius]
LAELSLLTRETVSRNLRKFKEEGLILIQDKRIFVKDIKLLKEKVNCEGCIRDYCSYS